MMRADFPTANRWQLRSVAVYALGVRFLPLAVVGVVVGSTRTSPWTVAFFAPSMSAFILGTFLGFPAGLVGGGPDFFVQRAVFLGVKYALRRRHPSDRHR